MSNRDFDTYNKTISTFLNYYNIITDDFIEKIIHSLKVLTEVSATILRDEKIYISFNGGKDCLCAYIILKYYFYCLQNNINYTEKASYIKFINNQKGYKITEKRVFLIYFINENNFDIEEDYVIRFAKNEGLQVIYLYSDYITGMNELISRFKLDVIVMGTRKDDIKLFSNENELLFPSTAPYPEFMRFMPVFNWSYEDVWMLILSTKTEYLELYKMGYSSIGRKNNTRQNQTLLFSEGLILPAWCLEENIDERNFRT
jgi:3'-phosphoadenosine 5'-phosphosulfate sulfotransferase (PAPS reductase)/FAD synthetase